MRALETRPRATRGFTLVELVIVIVVTGVLGATLAVFLRPAVDSWLTVRDASDLVEQGDTALRRMIRELRTAVPNSIRLPEASCFEFVPTVSGGRYRADGDTVNDDAPLAGSEHCTPGSTCSAVLDVRNTVSVFDVLTPLSTLPAADDWVVVGNQSPDQVYGGSNRALVTGVSTPAASQGRHRIAIAATQFPASYGEGRFTIVPASGPVFYVCSGADGSRDADGNGRGTLVRLSGYGWNATYPTACPSPSGGAVLALNVESCQFLYDPNQGATQQNGYVALQVTLTRRHASTTLVFGAHVANAP